MVQRSNSEEKKNQNSISFAAKQVFGAGITTAIIIPIEKQCPKTGSFQAAIPRWSLGSKKVVVISPGLSQNRSFIFICRTKVEALWCKKLNSWSFFVNFRGQR